MLIKFIVVVVNLATKLTFIKLGVRALFLTPGIAVLHWISVIWVERTQPRMDP